MTSGYRLILIMESVQVKRSIFPPAHVPLPPPLTRRPRASSCALTLSLPPSSHPSLSPAISVLLFALRAPAISISRHLSTTSRSLHRSLPPSSSTDPPLPRPVRSLISISSRRVENIARVSSYARRTRECQIPSFVLHFAGLDGEAKADTKYTRNVRYRELYCLCINDHTYVRAVRYEGWQACMRFAQSSSRLLLP